MNYSTRRHPAFLGALLLLASFLPLAAGEKTVVAPTASSPWSGSLSTGWDSLYMFRGVNQLPGFGGYGSSISWTALSFTWAPTASDSLTISSWSAFGLSQSDYKEIDGTLTYTRTFGPLSLSAGYALYAVLSAPDGLYSNELTISAAYDLSVGPITITPSIDYDYTLGPQPGNGGYIPASAGYLQLRLDGTVPLYRELLSANPWIAAGFSFGYNSIQETSDQSASFTGTDHLEAGLAFSIALDARLSLTPYLSYSHAWVSLIGTRPDTFWAGASLDFSF